MPLLTLLNPCYSCPSLPYVVSFARNVFGLVRQFFVEKIPTVDPKECVALADLLPLAGNTPVQAPSRHSKWLPFLNKNSFLLGNWHWNSGLQKLLSEFKELIDIIGDPSFNPDDIHD